MKIKLLIIFSVFQLLVLGQRDTTLTVYGKKYKLCICEDITKLNCPDTIEGIMFLSAGLEDFPTEVFRFKNLKIIDFSAFSWKQKYNSLTKKQRKYYDKKYNMRKEEPGLFYKPNKIKKLPPELINLKNLEALNLFFTQISEEEYINAEKLLPNVAMY